MEATGFRETLAFLAEHFGKMTINLNEYANYLGCDYNTARRAIIRGELPGKKMGGKWIIPVDQIARFECRRGKAAS